MLKHVDALQTEIFVCEVIYAILSFFGALENILTVAVVLSYRRMRTTANLLIANMSITSILICTTILPLQTIIYVTQDPLLNDELFCRLYTTGSYLLGGNTLMDMAVVSIDRLYAIHSPIRHKMVSKSKLYVGGLVFVSWAFPLLLLTPALAYSFDEKDQVDQLSGSCNDTRMQEACSIVKIGNIFLENPVYNAVMHIGAFGVPAIIIVICYMLIIMLVYKSSALQKTSHDDANVSSVVATSAGKLGTLFAAHKLSASATNPLVPSLSRDDLDSNSSTNESRPDATSKDTPRTKMKSIRTSLFVRNLKRTKMMAIIICLYFVLYAPYMSLAAVSENFFLRKLGGICFVSANCVNPLIYNFRDHRFRQANLHLFRRLTNFLRRTLSLARREGGVRAAPSLYQLDTAISLKKRSTGNPRTSMRATLPRISSLGNMKSTQRSSTEFGSIPWIDEFVPRCRRFERNISLDAGYRTNIVRSVGLLLELDTIHSSHTNEDRRSSDNCAQGSRSETDYLTAMNNTEAEFETCLEKSPEFYLNN